ncbi:MAG: desulfoferrodoxin family protein [Oscillospiraceae bacterium]
MCEQKFFRCDHCGNLIGLINNAGVPLICCGEEMRELMANTTEASTEKHIPDVKIFEDIISVQIGSTIHPMLDEHHIEFIYLQTENGGQRKCLRVGNEPVAVFKVVDDKPIAVFEYCNLHGLWKIDL